MQLILASHVTPIIKELLKLTTPQKSNVIVVMNARDYHDPENFRAVTEEKVAEFKDAGFKNVVPLDLKTYFDSPEQLQSYLKAQNPNVICAVGGDVFLLNTAIKLSGFDQYLKSAPKDLIYCGSSAGAIVVSQDLTPYDTNPDSKKLVHDHYGVTPEYTGLALLNDYIVPHLGERAFAEDVKQMSRNLESAGKTVHYVSKSGVVRAGR